MTGRERLLRIFEANEVVGTAFRLWGLEIGQQMLHPAYQPMYNLLIELTDIMVTALGTNDGALYISPVSSRRSRLDTGFEHGHTEVIGGSCSRRSRISLLSDPSPPDVAPVHTLALASRQYHAVFCYTFSGRAKDPT